MYNNLDNEELIATRISTNSKKWSRYTSETIPFWIADMDFKSPDFLVNDIIGRANQNYFGYTDSQKDLPENISKWYSFTKKIEVNHNNIVFSTSVLNSYETILDSFLTDNDKILFFIPIYTQLMKIASKKYTLIEFDMREYPYKLDLDLLKEKIEEIGDIKAIVLCNPHNPIGKLWRSEELINITNLCRERNILLISDEIHSDLIYKNEVFNSLWSYINDNDTKMFVLNSPGKTFNVSGLKTSFILSNSNDVEFIREKIKERRYNEIDIFSLVAMNSLYKNKEKSLEWLANIMEIIESNYRLVVSSLKNYSRVFIPKIKSTYLLWIKIEKSTCEDSEEMREILIKKYGIDLHEGTIFGNSGKYYLRMNIACPKNILGLGLKRLQQALDNEDI